MTFVATDEPIPTPADLRRLLNALEARARRFARNLAIGMSLPGIGITILFAIISYGDTPTPAFDLRARISSLVMLLIFGSVLPALGSRWVVLKDLRWLPDLISRGTVYRGRLVWQDLRSFRGGASYLSVRWQTDTGEHAAHLDVPALEDNVNVNVFIVSDGGRRVGVVLNGKLLGAKRRIEIFQSKSSRERPSA